MPNPEIQAGGTVTFQILSDGKKIDNAFQILSIKVRKAVNTISSCEIELHDGSSSQEDWPVSDSRFFVPGAEIEVKAGYNGATKTIFKGIVMSQNLKLDRAAVPALIVNCFDKGIRLTIGRKNATYLNKKDSEVWKTIIDSQKGVASDIQATKDKLPQIVQYYVTDWDFIVSRAEFNGMVAIANNNRITIAEPGKDISPVLAVKYGLNMLDFNADLSALHQYQNINSQSWDVKSQKVTSSSVRVSDDGQGNLSSGELSKVIGLKDYVQQTNASLDNGSLGTWSKAQATKSKYAKIRGEVSFEGSSLVEPGNYIELTGLSDRFNGDSYVSGITHTIADGNWITNASMGLSDEWYAKKVVMQAPLAAGVLPGIQGIQNGIVKQIDKDPDNDFRVLVEMPLLDEKGKGIWARLSTQYADNKAGMFFYPEIGDEVILAFLNDDPRYPVILGAVYSKQHQPPFSPDKKNSTKAIVTKGNLKLVFDDDKMEVTVITPRKNQFVLSDRKKGITVMDEHKNSIVMSSSGITVSSATDLNLDAKRSVRIKAGANIKLDAGASVDVNGQSIDLKAKAQVEVHGQVKAALTAGGQAVVKAAMVKIN